MKMDNLTDNFNYSTDNLNETGGFNTTVCNATSPYFVGGVAYYEFILKCGFLPVVAFGGLIGNTLCYVVLRKETKQKSMNFLLKVLVIADNLNLISLLLFQTIPASYSHSGWALNYIIFYQTIGKPCTIFFQWSSKMTSIYLTILVSLERYVAISKPLQVQTICTLKNAKIGAIIITVVSIIYNLPKFLYYEMFHEAYDPCMDKVMPIALMTDIYKSRLFKSIYVLGMYYVVIYIFPLTALSVLNTFLIIMVRRSYKERARLGGKVSNERCTEKIIGIVTAFILLETPAIVVNIYYGQKRELTAADFQMLNMIYILSAINCVINFYIYVLVGKAFRDKVMIVLGLKKASERHTSSHRKNSDSGSVIRPDEGIRNGGGRENGACGKVATIEFDQVTHL